MCVCVRVRLFVNVFCSELTCVCVRARVMSLWSDACFAYLFSEHAHLVFAWVYYAQQSAFPVLTGPHGDFTHTYVQLDIYPFTNASTKLLPYIRWRRLVTRTCWSADFHTVTEIFTRLKWQTRLSTFSMKCVTLRCNIDPRKRFCFESASTQDRAQQVCCLALGAASVVSQLVYMQLAHLDVLHFVLE